MLGIVSISASKPNPWSETPFDLISIDADKVSQVKCLEIILSHSSLGKPSRTLCPSGIIVVDNALNHGVVADLSDAKP